MSRVLVLVVALIMSLLVASSAVADRLILIPTGRTLGVGGIKAEIATDGDSTIYWVNLGLPRIEVEGARFEGFAGGSADVASAQIQIIPGTILSPDVAVGVRDIGDSTSGLGMPYNGRAYYAVASMGIPVTGGVPVVFQDVRLHGGVGTGDLSGVFFGIEGRLPMGVRVAAEYDSDDFNLAASYDIVPAIRARASWIKGDFYYGGVFSTAF